MAGNNLLRILRASRDRIAGNNSELAPGQMLFDKTDNYIFAGGGTPPNRYLI